MTLQDKTSNPVDERRPHGEYWFPGRWAGGVSLILGPLLLLAGILLRIQFRFFFPYQLEAFQQHPTLIAVSYSCFLAGNMVLWPAIVTLSRTIGQTKPGWAFCGGTLVLFGLFARTFHAGADHLAFQMARTQGVPSATAAMAASYGAFHIVSALNGAILLGWIVLAIGAYRSGTMGLSRSVALALMSSLMMGVLKGSSWTSVLAAGGLCYAFLPAGVEVLRAPPKPKLLAVLAWAATVTGLIAALFIFGQLG